MLLTWRDVAPLPDTPSLKVWTSLTPGEANVLRHYAKDKRVVEVGAAFGFSTVVLASVARSVVSIDPHNAEVVPGNFNLSEEADLERLRDGTYATLLRNLISAGLDHKVSIISEVSQKVLPLWGKRYGIGLPVSFEFAFIDGDHAYDAEMMDMVQCHRLGVTTMCIHDYGEENWQNHDVKRMVHDWLGDHPDWQFVEVVDTMALLGRK